MHSAGEEGNQDPDTLQSPGHGLGQGGEALVQLPILGLTADPGEITLPLSVLPASSVNERAMTYLIGTN